MKLTAINNWEALEYYIDGNRINPLSVWKVKINKLVYTVKWIWECIPYDDHGHTYEGCSYRGYVRSKDLKILVGLTEITSEISVFILKEIQ